MNIKMSVTVNAVDSIFLELKTKHAHFEFRNSYSQLAILKVHKIVKPEYINQNLIIYFKALGVAESSQIEINYSDITKFEIFES